MRKRSTALALALFAIAAIVVSGCGGGSDESGGGTKGGEVTVLDTAGGVDSLDPGYWYYQTDYSELGQTTQRWLYSWKPEDTKPSPDLAAGPPKLSNGGKTITIKIKSGIKYSPPLQNRTVKSADIKYAMERCALPQVGNGYFGAYYTGIVGAKDMQSQKAKEIKGIQTPDDSTLVIKTEKPVGILANANALALPCTVPVPKDYAQKYDKGKQSTYGSHQVFTGPYMIQGAQSGTVPKSGYSEGKQLTLVRNPSWNKANDYRPAFFNKITFKNGDDPTVASKKILEGESLMSGDYAAPPTPVLKSALSRNKDQLNIEPSQGNRYIGLNTTVKPLDDVNVRKALAAVTDRTALRQTRGGPTLGPLANHFIPPEMPGFEEAGGEAGPGYDFYKSPTGDVELAKSYMKKAGFKDGMYHGPPLLVVADNDAPAKQTAESWQAQVEKIGFKMNLRLVPHATVTGKFCSTPKLKVAICPTLGWGKDFFDPQSMLDPIFNGKNIAQSGNVNVAQANDPKLNAAMDKAAALTDPAQRAKAWGKIDRDATGKVFVIVWLWDNQINFASKNVKGVRNKFNSSWDMTFSSLK
jgi:peptide/nickel transport system substrate-binding protein